MLIRGKYNAWIRKAYLEYRPSGYQDSLTDILHRRIVLPYLSDANSPLHPLLLPTDIHETPIPSHGLDNHHFRRSKWSRVPHRCTPAMRTNQRCLRPQHPLHLPLPERRRLLQRRNRHHPRPNNPLPSLPRSDLSHHDDPQENNPHFNVFVGEFCLFD